MTQNKNLVWEADEFRHYPKNLGWYITLISISILFIAFFIIIEKDLFAAVSLAIISFLIILFSRHKPNRVVIELSHRGVHFGQLFYPYKQIKHFWVVHSDNHHTVNFHTSALVNNMLVLELEEQDPENIRLFLIQFLPEHHQTEPTMAQRIMHRFKF